MVFPDLPPDVDEQLLEPVLQPAPAPQVQLWAGDPRPPTTREWRRLQGENWVQSDTELPGQQAATGRQEGGD